MESLLLFPMESYWTFYIGFIAFVCVILALDLGVFHRTAHAVSVKESLAWSVVWVSLAIVFNIGLYYYSLSAFAKDERLLAVPGFSPDAAAWQVSLEFLTGFIIEKALAVDNIFIFVVVCSFTESSCYPHKQSHSSCSAI